MFIWTYPDVRIDLLWPTDNFYLAHNEAEIENKAGVMFNLSSASSKNSNGWFGLQSHY